MKKKDRKPSWNNVKAALRPLECPALVGVIRDLYDASADNRRFLRVNRAVRAKREDWQERLRGIVSRSAAVGWGYCDAVSEIIAALDPPAGAAK